MKKNITLISLMLGVMLLVSVTGMVSSDEDIGNSRYPKEITLNGGNEWTPTYWGCANNCLSINGDSVTVAPGETIEVSYNVLITEHSLWASTKWDVIGDPSDGCEDHINANTNDHHIRTFDITAPSTPGTYNLTLYAAYTDACPTNGFSGKITLKDAIIVEEPVPEVCELTITNPVEDEFFDSEVVPIEWHVTEACTPINQFVIQYQSGGTCNEQGPWSNIISGLDSSTAQNPAFPDYHYVWDKPSESGQYCVTVKVTSAGVSGYSEIFNVDHAKPVVNLTNVGNPSVGGDACLEGGEGDCYVSNQTQITLSCADNNPVAPWQSGVDYIEYRYQVNGGSWTNWFTLDGDQGTFSFPEDSEHTLEYRCVDNVNKISETKTKNFIVDAKAPTLSKTIGEPNVCYGEEPCTYYVTQDTDICLSAVDSQPHPVGGVEIWCEYWYSNINFPQMGGQPNVGPFRVDTLEGSCFNFGEDSYHSVHCWAVDTLGNEIELIEQDIVDTVAPLTDLTFEGPYHVEQDSEKICTWDKVKYKKHGRWYWKWVKTCEIVTSSEVQWIDGVSTVNLTASDPQPHPVGVDKTFYRYGVVDNSYCLGEASWNGEYNNLEQDWTEYTAPFSMEESCHAIEYYSVDKLGNKEITKTEFVFVDKTAPETIKEVGDPSAIVDYSPQFNWYENPNQNIEWEVTLNTTIEISCGDVGAHPSGLEGMWYRIVWDGKYNDSSADWQFTDNEYATIQFTEKSEHLLEFYCVDNVNKTSKVDSELFKVKGTAFNLEIGSKWDLVSVPFQLIGEGKVDEVFNNSDIIEVWSYENGVWKVHSANTQTLTHIIPGRGYWIKSVEDTSVLIGGELYADGGGVIPISGITLDEGWNLIGHYGIPEKTSYCSLFRLVDGNTPTWSNLLKYNSDQNVQSLIEVDLYENMIPGRGYWIDMKEGGTYRPSSICMGYTF